VVFIFATTELQKVPATIKSRCQRFNFRLVSVETVTALLRDACSEMKIEAEDEALFWIARESTGSCRDAYTLFDQVVSFSEGHIRAELIREKLGLVGLEKLNEFAEACALGNFSLALSLVDSLLGSGVAVETFITDLAGYYHSLLLLKAGVTREATLGYPAEQFSQVPLETYDALRLERAGELLYDLHRDIRYSVSPRFELETLVSKLCWLPKWISPAELGDAVARAQSALGNSRPLAGGEAAPPVTQVPQKTADVQVPPPGVLSSGSAAEENSTSGGGRPGSLADEFDRRMAARESQKNNPRKAAAQNTGSSENSAVSPDVDPGVQKVVEVFKGTVVEENR
jgi:DNA polymerase-3 subunit gamma/tau